MLRRPAQPPLFDNSRISLSPLFRQIGIGGRGIESGADQRPIPGDGSGSFCIRRPCPESYTAAGQVTAFNYGNGVQAAFTYNSRLQLASLRYSYSSTDLLDLAYNYGVQNNGQIASIQYFNGATEDTSRSVNFTYDAWSRLKIANTTDLSDAGTRNEGTWKLQWDYDRFGNRVNQDLIGGVGFSAYQPQLTISSTTNRITDAGYAYDAAGNMTADPQHAYAYDAENRMTAVDTSVAKYAYDANGLRVRKSFNGTDTYYVLSGTKVVAEYDVVAGQTTAIREYVYSGSQLVATLASDGQGGNTTTTYHHPDHLSVRVNTNTGGSKIGEQAHLPFGDLWYSFESTSKWRFTTYERDPESDNDYAIFRYHVDRLGRFSSPDPLGGDITNPQSLNRYAYVLNDPISSVDPLGFLPAWRSTMTLACLLDPTCSGIIGAYYYGIPIPEYAVRDVTEADVATICAGEDCGQIVVDATGAIYVWVPAGKVTHTIGGSESIGNTYEGYWSQVGTAQFSNSFYNFSVLTTFTVHTETIATIGPGPNPNAKKEYCSDQANKAALEAVFPMGSKLLPGEYRPSAEAPAPSGAVVPAAVKELAEHASEKAASSDSLLSRVKAAFGLPKTLGSKILKGIGYLGTAITAKDAYQAMVKEYRACME